MQVEIQQYPTQGGFTHYHIRADGITMARVAAETKSPDLMAEVLARAVEGVFRDGRPWAVRS